MGANLQIIENLVMKFIATTGKEHLWREIISEDGKHQ